MVDTAKTTDRRKLHYNSIDDLSADIDRIVAADRAGKLRRTGNWTAGQAMGHLAAWINYAYEGFPIPRPPWPIRLILGFLKRNYLRDGLPAGVKIPNVEGGTTGTEPLSTEQGADVLRKALARLRSSEPARYPSPAWGEMPHDELIALNLRHAELHMSFLHP